MTHKDAAEEIGEVRLRDQPGWITFSIDGKWRILRRVT